MKESPKRLQFLLVAALVLGLAGCAWLKARDQLNKGVRAYKAANMEKAIEYFKVALEHDPDLTVAQLYLATAIANGFVPNASSERNTAVAREAIAEFEKVLEKEPENTNALRNIASIYFGMKDMEDAKKTRYRLIEIDPGNPEHWYTIGVINWTITYARRQGLRHQAGIQDKPERPLPRRRIRALKEQNEALVDEGIEALLKARDLNPNDWQAATYLNLMYREKADIVLDSQEREDLLQRADVLADEALRLQKMPVKEGAPGS